MLFVLYFTQFALPLHAVLDNYAMSITSLARHVDQGTVPWSQFEDKRGKDCGNNAFRMAK